MKLYVYSRVSPALNLITTALAAKWAYLFADAAIANGQVEAMYHARRAYEWPMNVRMEAVERHYQARKQESLATLRVALHNYKALKQKKHKRREELVWMREFEQLINNEFERHVESVATFYDKAGLTMLAGLAKGKGLEFYPSDPMSDERLDEGLISASRVMQLAHDKDADQSFILPPQAMHCELLKKERLSPDDAAASGENCIWMEQVMQLPGINSHDAAELESLRRQLQEPGMAMRTAFDTWLRAARDSIMNTTERLQFYRETFRPAAAALNDHCRENIILNAWKKSQGAGDILGVWVAELPLARLWDIYEAIGQLSEASREALSTEQALARGRQRIPVIILDYIGDNPKTVQVLQQKAEPASTADHDELPQASRKRIRIDEEE